MTNDTIKVVAEAMTHESTVVFAYLFGSMASGTASERSDWDIAVYLRNEFLEENPVWQKFGIEDRLSCVLGTDAVEVILLNRMDNSLLAFEIINKSILLVDNDKNERMLYECKVLGHYQDWRYFMSRHMESERYEGGNNTWM